MDTMFDVAKKSREPGQRKTQVAFELGAELHQLFTAVCKGKKLGRSKQDVGYRLIKWFCAQPDIVRTAVTQDVDVGMEAPYAQALELLSATLRKRAAEYAASGQQIHDLSMPAGDDESHPRSPPPVAPEEPDRKPQSRRHGKT